MEDKNLQELMSEEIEKLSYDRQKEVYSYIQFLVEKTEQEIESILLTF